jgi:hypothetical protein
MLITVDSQNERLLGLVRDFALGLGSPTNLGRPRKSRSACRRHRTRTLLHLLTHVALSATKSGVEPGEPLCCVTFQEDGPRPRSGSVYGSRRSICSLPGREPRSDG